MTLYQVTSKSFNSNSHSKNSDYALAILWIGVLSIIIVHFVVRRNSHDLHHAILSLVVTICLVNTLTSVLKTMAGRYRPNWLSTYAADNSNEGRYSFP